MKVPDRFLGVSAAAVSAAPARKLSPNPLIAFYQSSIGKKIVVAITGLILIVYVLGHLLGNLQIYWSADRLNIYAEFLHSLGSLLWLIRVFLLAAFIVHFVATIQLTIQNRQAKPQKVTISSMRFASLQLLDCTSIFILRGNFTS